MASTTIRAIAQWLLGQPLMQFCILETDHVRYKPYDPEREHRGRKLQSGSESKATHSERERVNRAPPQCVEGVRFEGEYQRATDVKR